MVLELSLFGLGYVALLATVLVLLRAAKRADEEIEREYEAFVRDRGTVPWSA